MTICASESSQEVERKPCDVFLSEQSLITPHIGLTLWEGEALCVVPSVSVMNEEQKWVEIYFNLKLEPKHKSLLLSDSQRIMLPCFVIRCCSCHWFYRHSTLQLILISGLRFKGTNHSNVKEMSVLWGRCLEIGIKIGSKGKVSASWNFLVLSLVPDGMITL